MRRIEGRHNALVKELRRAFTRGELTSDGYCAIEGSGFWKKPFAAASLSRRLFQRIGRARADRLLSQLGAQVETLLLPDKLFASIVPSETPQGVAALARWKEFSLEDVLAKVRSWAAAGHCRSTGPGKSGDDPAFR